MKLFLALVALSISLFAQNAFSDGKIDMHGGKYESYGSMTGYQNGGFHQSMSLSNLRDTNTTKTSKAQEKKTKN